MMANARRDAAAELAEELLTEIETRRLGGSDIVLKASRLARLLDDTDAVIWMRFEIQGYKGDKWPDYAARSGRQADRQDDDDDDTLRFWTASINSLHAELDAAMMQLNSAVDAPVSVSSANPNQYLSAPQGNFQERSMLRDRIEERRSLIDKIIGSVYAYVSEKAIEIRFGSAVESAFGIVRAKVDGRIAALVPDAAVKFAAAFENATSGNSEHWANAAGACRRLLQAVADVLQPAGPPVDGRPMTEEKYINRLIHFIDQHQSVGETYRDVISSDLEDLGKRIDAVADAGHKGAHAEVTQYEASRFLTGTYLLVGDILVLADENDSSYSETTAPDSANDEAPASD